MTERKPTGNSLCLENWVDYVCQSFVLTPACVISLFVTPKLLSWLYLTQSFGAFFFGRTGFELWAFSLQVRCSTAWTRPPVHFALVILEMESWELLAWVGFKPWSSWSQPPKLARITGVIHQCPPNINFLLSCTHLGHIPVHISPSPENNFFHPVSNRSPIPNGFWHLYSAHSGLKLVVNKCCQPLVNWMFHTRSGDSEASFSLTMNGKTQWKTYQ
jgi:hypothetical protein